MASTMTAIQTVTVGAGGSASISFTSIPQTYTDLKISYSAKSSFSGAQWGQVFVSFNGSTALMSNRNLYGNGSSASSGVDLTTTGGFATTGGTGGTSAFSNTEICIPNYTSANNKSFSVDSAPEMNATSSLLILGANLWSNTAAITSITLTDYNASFVQYSTFTLYGVYKDAAETTPAAPTIGTATAGSQAADVAFTPAGSGAPASSYVVTSSPGGLTATGGSSPIQIGGLTSGTAYTFTVRGQNPGGLGAASAASNSVTPYDGYESIATVYGSGGSTLTFSSIPSSFTHLQIRGISRLSTGGGSGTVGLQLNFNSDFGNNYTANHVLYGNGSSALSASSGTSMAFGSVVNFPQSAATSNAFGVVVADILDYANTNKYKTVRGLGGYDGNDTNGIVTFRSFAWMNTAAISNITFTSASGNFASGTVFELYGIRG
jgi:hypothetical protein